ncbi:MAG: helix-turn-helix transcriptional regulator [Clostridia bacterium]|nr:helix-turn-helix transcriptional regulator [Clostridia bacterium]
MPKTQSNKRSLNYRDRSRRDLPLAVNCAGEISLGIDFCTDNGRGRHDFYFLYLVEGELEVRLSDGNAPFKAGSAVVFYAETPYYYRNVSSKPIKYYFVHYSGSQALEFTKKCGFSDHVPVFAGIHRELISTIEQIILEGAGDKELSDLKGGAELLRLLVETRRWSLSPDSSRLESSLEYLHRHFSSPLLIEDLAQIEHLSPGRYRALFAARTGSGPKEYVTSLRLEKSMELLRHTGLSVAEVAESVGFADQLYFSRVFRKKVGVSPTEYRKNKSE